MRRMNSNLTTDYSQANYHTDLLSPNPMPRKPKLHSDQKTTNFSLYSKKSRQSNSYGHGLSKSYHFAPSDIDENCKQTDPSLDDRDTTFEHV